MQKTCNDCGRSFIAIKPYFVVCFDCHLARIRKAQAARASLFLPSKSRDIRYTRNMDKQTKNKLSMIGGDRDEMPGND